MEFKKGDRVQLKDGNIIRGGTVVTDGIDNKGKVRIRPDGIPMDLSITTEKNDNVYVITQ